jgi:ferredoxin
VNEQAGPARWVVTVGSGCIGSGMCLATAPSYFSQASDGKSRPVHDEVDANEPVRDAAAFCPVEAISVTDARTGEPLEP